MKIPTDYFIFVNIAVAIIYLIVIITSYKNGLIYSVLWLVLRILSVLVSLKACVYLTNNYPLIKEDNIAFELFDGLSVLVNNIIWFVISFLILSLIVMLILKIAKKISKIPVIGFFNKIGGALVGVIGGTITVLILSMILSLPIFVNGQEVKDNTVLKYISSYSEKAYDYVVEKLDLKAVVDKVSEYVNDFDLPIFDKNGNDNTDFKKIIEELNVDADDISKIMDELNIDSVENLEISKLSDEQKAKLLDLLVENAK